LERIVAERLREGALQTGTLRNVFMQLKQDKNVLFCPWTGAQLPMADIRIAMQAAQVLN